MELVHQRTKTHYPLPGICIFGLVLAVLANLAFQHACPLLGEALVAGTVIMMITAFLTGLTLSDSRALPGRTWTSKDVRNYNRSVTLLCKTATLSTISCMLLFAAAVVALTGETSFAGIICAIGIFTFGRAVLTYLQGPAEPYEY